VDLVKYTSTHQDLDHHWLLKRRPRLGFGGAVLETNCCNVIFQRPLITGSPDLFKKIINLKHSHVIEMLEYVVGMCGVVLEHIAYIHYIGH